MSKNKMYIVIICVITILVILFVSGQIFKGKSGESSDGPTYQVKRGPLTISFVESGTIKARDQIIIKNEVEGRTSIISLIPEGTRVKKGQLLVELDASSLEDQKIDQEIRVQNAEASYIGSNENLAVVENQAKSDVDLAKLNLEFAKQDLEKYIQGEYPYKLDEADRDITVARSNFAQAQKTLEWSFKLFKDHYISETELEKDKLDEQKKNLDVKLAQKSKELLTEYTYKRDLAQFKSDVSQAEMALERKNRKAKADVIQAKANLKAKEAEYHRQKDKLQKNADQIKKTKIYAPADGLVIYATSAKSGFRRMMQEPLDEGQDVRERQELIYLPTANSSKAEVAIHESNLEKVRAGLPVIITVDALLGKRFFGTIAHIAPLPDAQSMWMNPDLKVYSTDIYLDSNDSSLRTGMSCQAEIIIEQYDDAVYIPVQAVLRVGGESTVYVVSGKTLEPRKVEIGLDNNRMVRIISGLKAGEVVSLTPPLKSAAVEPTTDVVTETISVEQKKVGHEPVREASMEKPLEEGKPAGQKERMRERFKDMSPEEREKMRERFRNMSPEERERIRKERQR